MTLPFTGADLFLLLDDGSSLLGYSKDYAVGPFTLVKKAGAAAKSLSKSGKFSIPTYNLTPRMNVTPRMERVQYLKQVNLVELR